MSTEPTKPDTSTENIRRTVETMRRVADQLREQFPARAKASVMVNDDASLLEALVNERDALRRGSHDKRDMFALHAMSSLLIRGADVESEGPLLTARQRRQALADSAYAIADAMCERRISR